MPHSAQIIITFINKTVTWYKFLANFSTTEKRTDKLHNHFNYQRNHRPPTPQATYVIMPSVFMIPHNSQPGSRQGGWDLIIMRPYNLCRFQGSLVTAYSSLIKITVTKHHTYQGSVVYYIKFKMHGPNSYL